MPLRKHNEELDEDPETTRLLLDGDPFTGVLVPVPGSPHRWESEYQDGLPHGHFRSWWPSGQTKSLQESRWGSLHGFYKRWYEKGNLEEESVYELGICKHRKRWDEEGNLIEEYTLEEGSKYHGLLLAYRKSCYGHEGEERGDEILPGFEGPEE
ncbi:Hypothetical protein PBC10988_3620 [Planctomycetales bacterium 10988]|nr:Hypothetical protein PBC10988_3620 [Planctomycetales bacterium 10988]